VQTLLFSLSPSDYSSAVFISEKLTLSVTSMAPEMLKCLILVAYDIEASWAALQAQHLASQFYTEAVFGIY